MRLPRTVLPCLAAVFFALSLLSSSCKSPVGPQEPAPPQKIKVTLEFDVYNHTQGYLTHFTRADVDSGTQLTISVSDIGNIAGVDQTHIIIREDSTGGKLGKRIAWDKATGTATFTVPSQNTDYDVFLLNDTGKYNIIDEIIDKYSTGAQLRFPRDCTYQRQDRDGKTGPEQPIIDAINQLNSALSYSGIVYGTITKVESSGNLGIGYCGCSSPGYRDSSYWAGINPDLCTQVGLAFQLVFIDEIYEMLAAIDDIAGSSSGALICDKQGNLNQIGIDLLCYVYVKDEKTGNQSFLSRLALGFK